MSSKEADVKELTSHEHQVLGSDFCSGYTDIFGKWNTGFDCPRMGNGETVYCCGTVTYKYCCTRREQHTSSGISQSVLIGSAVGSVLAIIVVTLVSCFICRKCVPYRRAHPSLNGGPLYTMHCSSTASGMANLYSFSGQTTTTTTPLDTPHVLLDMSNPEHHIYAEPMNGHRGISRHLAQSEGCGTPSDPPPPYNETHPRRESSQDSYALQCSSSQQRPPSNHNRRLNGSDVPAQNRQYWSTKF